MIFQEQFATGISPQFLSQEMTKEGGYIKAAANLAISGLMRRHLVEMRDVEFQGEWGSENSKQLFATDEGEDWLLTNQRVLNLRLASPDISSGNITSDDDIPF